MAFANTLGTSKGSSSIYIYIYIDDGVVVVVGFVLSTTHLTGNDLTSWKAILFSLIVR